MSRPAQEGETRMRIAVARELCVGAGQCVLTAPAIFSQDDEGVVRLIQPEPDPGERTSARAAAGYCPSRAITVAVTPASANG